MKGLSSFLTVLIGLTASSLLDAQAAAPVPPPAPRVAGTQFTPTIVSGPRYRAVLAPATPHDASAIGAALSSCSTPIVLDSLEASRLSARPRWADSLPYSARGRLVELTVTAQPGMQVNCTHPDSRVTFARHAIEASQDSVAHPANDVGAVAVSVDGRVVQPVTFERIPVLTIGPNGFTGTAGLSAIRVHLRFDDLLPRDARAARVVIRVAREAGGAFSELSVSAGDIDEILGAMLVPRVESLRLLQPEQADATLNALAEAGDPAVASADRARRYLQAGAALWALHDTSAAQLVLGRAAATEPCLQPAEGTDPALGVMMSERRVPTRCTPMPARQLLVAGLLPGGAMRKRALRGSGGSNYIVALVLAGTATSIGLHSTADKLHQRYRDEYADPARLYAEVRSRQSLANGIGIGTWAVWGGSVAWALWQERQYRRHLEGLRSDRAAPALRVEPLPRGLGFSLTFF